MSRSKSSTPVPNPDTLAPQGRQSRNSSRSLEATLKKTEAMNFHRLSRLIPNLPTIRIDKTLDELHLPFSSKTVDSLASICETMESSDFPARCTSVKVVDANNKPILFYLGRHLQYAKQTDQPIPSVVSKLFLFLKEYI